MQINYINQTTNTNFKQITITPNGEMALNCIKKSNRSYYNSLMRDIKEMNKKRPITKFWDLEIDGVSAVKNQYNLICKHIHKLTGTKFDELVLKHPTYWLSYPEPLANQNTCYSGQTIIPPQMLLFSRKNKSSNSGQKSNRILFDIQSSQEAVNYWHDFVSGGEASTIRTYALLEELSSKYESSINYKSIRAFVKKNVGKHENMIYLKPHDKNTLPSYYVKSRKQNKKLSGIEKELRDLQNNSVYKIEKFDELAEKPGNYTKITFTDKTAITINNSMGTIVRMDGAKGQYTIYDEYDGHIIEAKLKNGTMINSYSKYARNGTVKHVYGIVHPGGRLEWKDEPLYNAKSRKRNNKHSVIKKELRDLQNNSVYKIENFDKLAGKPGKYTKITFTDKTAITINNSMGAIMRVDGANDQYIIYNEYNGNIIEAKLKNGTMINGYSKYTRNGTVKYVYGIVHPGGRLEWKDEPLIL